jgi:hypothetical protein
MPLGEGQKRAAAPRWRPGWPRKTPARVDLEFDEAAGAAD